MAFDFKAATPTERLDYCMRHPAYNAWLGARVVSIDDARREIVIAFSARPEMGIHPDRLVVHGGVVAGLFDMVGHAAVAVWHGAMTPTITLQVDYLAPAEGTDFVARGFLRKLGRTVGRADAELWCGDKLVALARGSFSTK